jgi:hypothetical protein
VTRCQVRWTAQLQALQLQSDTITGVSLLSSAIVSYPPLFLSPISSIKLNHLIRYLGVFTGSYRDRCVEYWTSTLSSCSLAVPPEFAFAAVVGDPVNIRCVVCERWCVFARFTRVLFAGCGMWQGCLETRSVLTARLLWPEQVMCA